MSVLTRPNSLLLNISVLMCKRRGGARLLEDRARAIRVSPSEVICDPETTPLLSQGVPTASTEHGQGRHAT